MVKEIIIKFPTFKSKNKEKNKIEIINNENSTTQSYLDTMKKSPAPSATRRKRGKSPKRGKRGKSSSTKKRGGFFSYFRKSAKVGDMAGDSSGSGGSGKQNTIVFDKKEGNDIVTIYNKNGKMIKEKTLGFMKNLFKIAKERFSFKKRENLNKEKVDLIKEIKGATIIVKEESSFYRLMNKMAVHIKKHKYAYSIVTFVVVAIAFVLFLPFTGPAFVTLVPFAFSYLASATTIVFYNAVGVLTGIANAGVVGAVNVANAGIAGAVNVGIAGAVGTITTLGPVATTAVNSGIAGVNVAIQGASGVASEGVAGLVNVANAGVSGAVDVTNAGVSAVAEYGNVGLAEGQEITKEITGYVDRIGESF